MLRGIRPQLWFQVHQVLAQHRMKTMGTVDSPTAVSIFPNLPVGVTEVRKLVLGMEVVDSTTLSHLPHPRCTANMSSLTLAALDPASQNSYIPLKLHLLYSEHDANKIMNTENNAEVLKAVWAWEIWNELNTTFLYDAIAVSPQCGLGALVTILALVLCIIFRKII